MELFVSSLLLSVAAKFDKDAILGHKEGCDGMLNRWPIEFQERIHIFDGTQIDPMFINNTGKVRNKKKLHEFLVTMSHVHVANSLFSNNETNSYLFLEEDCEVVQSLQKSEISINTTASNIAQFVEKDDSWQFLRLGYNPAWQQTEKKAVRCRAECLCRNMYDGICFITPGDFAKKSICWIRSTVGYAVHRREWAALQKLGNCSMVANLDKFNLSIDNWLPGFSRDNKYRSPVHYLIPGIFYQHVSEDGSKKDHERAMEGFS